MSEYLPLLGQVALVTGGARRTGRFIATGLAKAGADIIIHYYHSQQQAESLAAEIRRLDRNAWCLNADLTDHSAVLAMVNQLKDEIGRLNILINNVGNYPQRPLLETSPKDIKQLFDCNFLAPIILVQELASLLTVNSESHVINMGASGVEHHLVNKKAPAYQITKNALFDATKILANELGSQGVRVNMLSPGQLFNSVDLPDNIEQAIPLRRTAMEADVMAALLYLLRPDSYSTGTNVEVGGGYRQQF